VLADELKELIDVGLVPAKIIKVMVATAALAFVALMLVYQALT
jgi:hypothetical protein